MDVWLNGPSTQCCFAAQPKTPGACHESSLPAAALCPLLARLRLQMLEHLRLALGKGGEEAPGCVQVGAQRAGSPHGAGLLVSPLADGPTASCPDESLQAAGNSWSSVRARGQLVPPWQERCVHAASSPSQHGTSRQVCEGDMRMRLE